MGIRKKPTQAACKKRGFSECFALVLNPSKYVNLCGCGARISGDTADVAAKVTLCNIQPAAGRCLLMRRIVVCDKDQNIRKKGKDHYRKNGRTADVTKSVVIRLFASREPSSVLRGQRWKFFRVFQANKPSFLFSISSFFPIIFSNEMTLLS